MSKEGYAVKLASFRWFLVANAVTLAVILLAWFLADGAMSVIDQQIPVRARPVAAFPIVLWIAWWFLTRVGKLWRGETLSEHDVWPGSRAWAVTGWIAVAASLLFAGILYVGYRH